MTQDPAFLETIRYLGGFSQAGITCTIHSNDDPLQLGRIQCAPENFDMSQVKPDNLPWVFPESLGPQTGVGGTPHTLLRPGTRCNVRFSPDGTGHMQSTISSFSGPEAPPGQQLSQKGNPQYPGNQTERA